MNSIRRRHARRRRHDEGQGLVEFALIVPMVLLLLIGIFEFANAWRAYQVVTDSGRELARRLVTDSLAVYTQASAEAVVTDAFTRAGLTGTPTVTVKNCRTFCSPQGQAFEADTVVVSYPHDLGMLKKMLGLPPVTLTSTFVMRSQY